MKYLLSLTIRYKIGMANSKQAIMVLVYYLYYRLITPASSSHNRDILKHAKAAHAHKNEFQIRTKHDLIKKIFF